MEGQGINTEGKRMDLDHQQNTSSEQQHGGLAAAAPQASPPPTTRLVLEVELLGVSTFSRDAQKLFKESVSKGLNIPFDSVRVNLVGIENEHTGSRGQGQSVATAAPPGGEAAVQQEPLKGALPVKVEGGDDVYNPKDVRPTKVNEVAPPAPQRVLPGVDRLLEALKTAAAMTSAPPDVLQWLCDLLQKAPPNGRQAGGVALCVPLIDVLRKFYLLPDVVRWASLLIGNWCREGDYAKEMQAAFGKIEGIFGLLVPIMVQHVDTVTLVRTIGFAMTGICMKDQLAIVLAVTPGAVKMVADVGRKHIDDNGTIGYVGYLFQRMCEDGAASLVAAESDSVLPMVLECAWHVQQNGEPMISAGLGLVLVEMFQFLRDEQKLALRVPVIMAGIRYLSMLGPPLKPAIAEHARVVVHLLENGGMPHMQQRGPVGPPPGVVVPAPWGAPAHNGRGVPSAPDSSNAAFCTPVTGSHGGFSVATSSFGKNPFVKQQGYIKTLRSAKNAKDAGAVLHAMTIMHGKDERRNYLHVEDSFGVLVTSMRRFLNSSVVIRNACLFIGNICSDEEVRLGILKIEGVMDLLFDALMRYAALTEVAQKIVFAISQLGKEVQRLAVVRDAVHALVSTADKHKSDRSVVQHVASVLRRFCVPEHLPELVREGGRIYEILVSSLQPTMCHIFFDVFDHLDLATKLKMADPEKYNKLTNVRMDVAGQEKIKHMQTVLKTLQLPPDALPPSTY